MSIKLIGAMLVIATSTIVGYLTSAAIQKEAKQLCQLKMVIHYMVCELRFRLSSLARLCELSAEQSDALKHVFDYFAEELDRQILPDPAICMDVALRRCKNISPSVASLLRELGATFGKFDLQGQISELNAVEEKCSNALCLLEKSKDMRVKNCQTLGFCIGVVMTIILL